MNDCWTTDVFSNFFPTSRNSNNNYPPYNSFWVDEEKLVLEMAVAGFEKDELQIKYNGFDLEISGKKKEQSDESKKYLHKGLASRPFQRNFEVRGNLKIESAKEATVGTLESTAGRFTKFPCEFVVPPAPLELTALL